MPISAPKPNSPPSQNWVDAFHSATALSTQVSEDGTQTVSLSAKDLAADTGVVAISGAADLSAISLTNINTAIQGVATFRANNVAEQSRLGFASEVLTINKANLDAASSRITDVDVAQESTQLARFNVLVQSGTAMLSQANQSAQTALKLSEYRKLDPGPLEEFVFYDHPSGRARIFAAMRWKAEHRDTWTPAAARK